MLKFILLLLVALFNLSSTTPCVTLYGQCGGRNYTGQTQCCSSLTCQYSDDDHSQCLPLSERSSRSVRKSGQQNGVTTRYWDCCKASCGWSGKASVSSPVKTCARNGVSPVDVNAQSGCNGGPGYMCSNQQPWSVSSKLSYGYAAAHINGKKESDWCCACYSLVFTSGPVSGKKLIVQVTNTGGDLGNNHFDLQIPGGGVGIFDGCSGQFPQVTKNSWGQQYGGVSQRSDCNKLPAVLRAGCHWRFDWFMNADNPKMRFTKVKCPSVLTAKTGCSRK